MRILPLLVHDRRSAIAFGLLAVLITTLLVSWPALSGPFLFDDFPNLENLASLNGRLEWASLANYASLYRSEPGRPLAMISFVINDFDWPSSPRSFKYTNLMLHLLIGVILFGLARALARLRTDGTSSDIVALLTAAAWLLHPMQLSTSMLVVQRMTQLSTLFALAGIWGYVALAHRARNIAIAVWAIVALGFGTLLAVLSKETGALVPLLAVIVNVTLLREHLLHLPPLPRRLLQAGVALPVFMLFVALVMKMDSIPGFGGRDFNLTERLLSEARALWDYIFNIVVPNLRGGGIYHDDFPVSRGLLVPWTTLPAVVGIISIGLGASLAYRRAPIAAFGVLWFLGGHLLESTIFPLELYFEHRNYLPMFGPLFSLAFLTVQQGCRSSRWLFAAAVIWISYSAWLTSIQAPIWGSRDALVTVWAIEHPQSPRAVQEKSAFHYRRGETTLAAATLREGYARGVRGSDFPIQVLLLACELNDEPMADSVRSLLRRSLSAGEYNRATLVTMRKFRRQVQAGACPSVLTEDGWLELTAFFLSNPRHSGGPSASYLYVERSYLFQHRRDLNATMLELEKAWAAHPTPDLAHLMAATLASAGLYDDAESWTRRALAIRTPGVRGWFAQDDTKSRQMLRALESLKAKRSEAHRD